MSINKLIVCSLFTALIAVLAQIAIPLPFSPIPFTGQILGVLLAGIILGSKHSALSIVAYLLLGAAGAPVFSLARGGIYMLIGPTGGYLWGFIPAVMYAGLVSKHSENKSRLWFVVALLPALALIYTFGAVQLSLIMGYTVQQVLLIGVLPYIPLDLLKVILSIFLGTKIKKSLQQNRLLP